MQAYSDQSSPALDEIIQVLRRRWLIIVVSTLVCAGLTVGYAEVRRSQAETRYQSTAQLALNLSRGGVSLPQLVILINDGSLGEGAQELLDDPASVKVSAAANPDIGVAAITAVSTDRAAARSAAQTYADFVIAQKAEEDRTLFAAQLAAQQTEVDEALRVLESAQAALSVNPEDPRLQAEVDTAQNGYRLTLETLRAIEAEGLPERQFSLLAAADSEIQPIGGYTGLGLTTHIALGLVLGILLGLGLAYLRDALDRRLGSSEAASAAYGLPVIAEVPDGGKTFAQGDSLAPPGSLITEAYRRLRTIVQLERDSRRTEVPGGYVVLVASASPEEGKSTTVAHLARSLAEVGNRVLCVSADFRRPKLHRIFGMPAHEGIASLGPNTNGAAIDPSKLVQRTPIEGVSLVAAGRGSSDPTYLLKAAAKLIAVARDHFDYIIVDSSPVLSANDTLDLLRSVDSVVAVARYKQTTKSSAERTQETLMQAGAPLLGVALTAVRGGEGYGYYYGYYSPDTEEELVR